MRRKKWKAFQRNLLNYVTSRLTEQHRQMVCLECPVVIIVYKWKFSLFREVNISFSENRGWFLSIHQAREHFFLIPFAFLLHKYTHVFIYEMGNPLLHALGSVILLSFSFLNVELHCQPTCTLWRRHQEKQMPAWDEKCGTHMGFRCPSN